jgi:subtilase family serine protease
MAFPSIYASRLLPRVAQCVVGLLLVVLAGCGGASTVTPTPTVPPAFQTTMFDLHLPPEALNAPVVGSLPESTVLHVSISFKLNQQVVDQLNTKKVPKGQNQNAQDAANKLGISDSEYQQIKAFFGIENASLNLNKLHTDLTVDAKASSFAHLFQVKFLLHTLNGRTFYAPDRNPQVPTFIANRILAITGLDSYSLKPRPGALFQQSHLKAAGERKKAGADCHPDAGLLSWSDVASYYSYDQLYQAGYHGEGMTVNLIEPGDAYTQTEVQYYASCVNYQGHLKPVNVGSPPSNEVGESTLDIEMMMGLAPAATIVVYQTSDDNGDPMNDLLQQIINDNVNNTSSGNVVSISYGVPEAWLTPQVLAAESQSLQTLTQVEHMTVFIASGDCGAFDIGDFAPHSYGQLAVDFPGSDLNAVDVGGTKIPGQDKSANEVVWSDGSNHQMCKNQWGSGGGLSQKVKHPDWQDAPSVQNRYSNGMRQLPDVSALAWNLATYYQGYGWIPSAGTSAAAPIWASGMVLVNQALLDNAGSYFYGPSLFYQVAKAGPANHLQPYYDITEGNNLYYPATQGWDYASGLGSPNLLDFYKTLLAMAKQS